MDSAPSDGIGVVDFRRQGMFLRWQVASGTWVACDVPPALVHGIALIRAAGPNLCLFGWNDRLHLQVGREIHELAGEGLRIKCGPVLASLGLRRRFVIEDSGRVLYRTSYWTGQNDDFCRWLAARAANPDWRLERGRSWSAGASPGAVRSA